MRPFVYFTLALLLFLFGLLGAREAAAFRWAADEKEVHAAGTRLRAFVDQWEDAVGERTTLWLTELGAGGSTLDRELFLRANVAWFDAFYVWEPGGVVWPPAWPDEDVASLRADPCLRKAAAAAGFDEPLASARGYQACFAGTPPVALLAASEAAELLLNANQPVAADRLVRLIGRRVGVPLREAAEQNIYARRLIYLRLQQARALDAQGRQDLAERSVRTLAREVTALDGANLENVLDLYMWPIAHDLRQYGGIALGGEDDEDLARAQRRLAAYQNIRDRRWAIEDAPKLADGPRLLVDPFGDPPWLMSYARLSNDTFVGLQLDQPELLQSLVARAPADLRPFLSVQDPSGRVLAGAQAPFVVGASFTRVLPHLRVGLTAGVLDRPWITGGLLLQLAPIGIGVLIGAFALVGLVATDRRQLLLLERQREFMTRVTHELKTPLAGIRLMAENLEMGNFRDDVQRERFARQIVKEAERLGLRLDEVIRAASRPVDEAAVATDVASMARQLGERWRPLFEQQRATLVVEVGDAPISVLVRPVQLRDALSNLLDNALKYRKPDGAARCWLRVKADRRTVTFEVEDDGIGVPPAMRRVVFDRFARVEGAGRGRAGGHGLGLAFVAAAARAHGGKVDCREGVEGGARFVLRIPRRP